MANGTVVATTSGPGKTYSFVRSTTSTYLTKATADIGFIFNFTLSMLPNVTELSTLFDQYRVDWLELNFLWQNTSLAAQFPTMYIAQDWDGVASAPANYQTVFQYDGMKVVAFDATHRIFSMRIMRPALNLSTATSSNAMVKRGAFVDLADQSEPFYGPIAFIGQFNNTANSGEIIWWFRVQVSTRAVR